MADDERKYVLGVDLDGVVADFYSAMKPIVAEWLGKNEDEMTDNVSVGLSEWGVEDQEQYESIHRFAVTQRNLFKKMDPIPGAPTSLRSLSESGIRIRIITHRLYIYFFHQEAVTQTAAWLENYGIPYWDLCFMSDKAAVGANLYIEDKPDNVRALIDSNHDVIMFGNPTNRKEKLDEPIDAQRAKNWSDAEEKILEYKKEWERTDGGEQYTLEGL